MVSTRANARPDTRRARLLAVRLRFFGGIILGYRQTGSNGIYADQAHSHVFDQVSINAIATLSRALTIKSHACLMRELQELDQHEAGAKPPDVRRSNGISTVILRSFGTQHIGRMSPMPVAETDKR